MTDLHDMPAEIRGRLEELLARMSLYHLDSDTPYSRNLVRDWRNIKDEIAEAGSMSQGDRWFLAIFRTPEFRNYKKVHRARYLLTPQGKRKKSKENRSYFQRLKADPERYAAYLMRQRERQSGESTVGAAI